MRCSRQILTQIVRNGCRSSTRLAYAFLSSSAAWVRGARAVPGANGGTLRTGRVVRRGLCTAPAPTCVQTPLKTGSLLYKAARIGPRREARRTSPLPDRAASVQSRAVRWGLCPAPRGPAMVPDRDSGRHFAGADPHKVQKSQKRRTRQHPGPSILRIPRE